MFWVNKIMTIVVKKHFITKKTIFYLLIIGGLTSCISKLKDDYWIRVCDIEGDSCGYKNKSGQWMIPLGKNMTLYTDTFRNSAIVSNKSQGMIGIDKNCKKLYSVHFFDNGPDQTSEGVFRIIIDNKYGFANMDRIVIHPKFDFVYPFSESLSVFNRGCTFKKEKDGDHILIVGGKYGYINKNGEIVIDAQYEYAESFTNGCARVIFNNKNVLIDSKGRTIGNW
jgi:hypothetical protein